jgi:hypothetical protein
VIYGDIFIPWLVAGTFLEILQMWMKIQQFLFSERVVAMTTLLLLPVYAYFLLQLGKPQLSSLSPGVAWFILDGSQATKAKLESFQPIETVQIASLSRTISFINASLSQRRWTTLIFVDNQQPQRGEVAREGLIVGRERFADEPGISAIAIEHRLRAVFSARSGQPPMDESSDRFRLLTYLFRGLLFSDSAHQLQPWPIVLHPETASSGKGSTF